MGIVQKFHSIKEIDSEFHPGIEELLSDYIVNFDQLVLAEKDLSKNIYLTYYLFFCSRKNSPIAITCLRHTRKKNTVLDKIKGIKTSISSSWIMILNIPSIIIEPGREIQVLEHYEKLVRDDLKYINKKEFNYKGLEFLWSKLNLSPIKAETFEDYHFACSYKSYQEYTNYLDDEQREEFKSKWSKFNELDFQLAQYSKLKEVFSYKRGNQKNLYKKIRKKNYLEEYSVYFTLEVKDEIQLVLQFTKNEYNNYFIEILYQKDFFDDEMIVQITILNSFELTNPKKLFLSNNFKDLDLKKHLFNSTKNIEVTANA